MKKLLLTLLCIFTLSSWHANAQLTEGFESGVFPPTNWTQEYVSAAVDWSTASGNTNGSVPGPNSGSLNASFVAPNYNGNSTRLVTPTLDLSAGASYDLSFYHTQVDWSGDLDVLTIYYKTSAAGAWVELVNYPSAVYSWTQRTITLPNISGDYYIAFQGTGNWGRGVTLDDVAVSLTPTCADASATMSAITQTTATATWDAANGAASYDWEVVPTGNAQGTGVVASGSGETGLTVSITGLTALTTYDFLISSDCTTDYASAVNFTTSVAPYVGCGDTDYDTGGPNGDYSNGEDYTITYAPDTPGDIVTIDIDYDLIEANWDKLSVYDGADITATQLSAEVTADVSYTASTGDGLTIRFTSDSSGTRAGWSLTSSCAAPPSCDAITGFAVDSFTASTAELSWTETTATSYNVEYGVTGFTQGTGTTSSETGGTASLSGLTSGTSYDVYVQGNCNGDVGPWNGPVSFTTLPGCGDTVSFCYSSGATVKQAELESSGDYITATVNSGSTESGWDFLIIYDSLDASGTVLYNASGDHTGVSVTSTTGLISAWVNADGSVDCGSSAGITEISMTFTCAAPPACENPSATMSAITQTTATATWDAANGAASYDWEVVPTGNAQGTGVVASGSGETGLSVSITGLTSNTPYDFLISSDCITDYASAVSFTTLCDSITSFALDFDSSTNIPDCTSIDVSNIQLGGLSIETDQSVSGTNSLRHRSYYPGDSSDFISQYVSTLGSNYRLNLSYWNNSNSDATLSVGTADEAGNFTLFEDVTITETFQWVSLSVDFSAYTGTDTRITLRNTTNADGGGSFYVDYYMDDIVWEEIPACLVVSDITYTSAGTDGTSSLVSWTENGTATNYNIEVYAAGADTSTATPVYTEAVVGATSTTVTGLTAYTFYDAYVQANCGFGGNSLFVMQQIYTGHCDPSSDNVIVFINDLTTTGGVTNISNTGTGYDGYGDYRAQSITGVYGTQSFDVNVTYDGTYGGRTHYWIDWNNDLEFDNTAGSSEFIGTSANGLSGTITVTIPAGQAAGDYVLRVALNNSTTASPDPCSAIAFGEFEDYTVSVIETPNCLVPDTLASANITGVSADLSWNETGTASSHTVYVFTADADPDTATPVYEATVNGVTTDTATGLTGNTTYDFYVAALCVDGLSVTPSELQNVPGTFTTSCEALSTPFTEDFENFTPAVDTAFLVENCWLGTDSTFYWEMAAGTDTGSGSTGPSPTITTGNYFYTEASAGAAGDIAELSTTLNLFGLTNPELSFDYHMYGGAMGTLDVIVDGTNVFTLSGQQQTSETANWITAIVDLSAYSGEVSIIFRGTRGTSFTSDMALDNVSIAEAPSCPDPTAFTATPASTTSADLAWTAGGTESLWNIEVYDFGADTTTATPVYTQTGATTTSATATGLTFGGDYTAYVQGDCSDVQVASDASAAWVGYANVYDLAGNYQFGSSWGLGDLKTTVDVTAGTLTLQPNFNTYADNPTDPYWVNQSTGEGNKLFEANTFVQNTTDLIGTAFTFTGSVSSNTIDAGYTAVAFIKVFNSDFSFVKIEEVPLVDGEDFSVTYTNVDPADTTIQYGYQILGVNANPANEVALGSVVVADGTITQDLSEWVTANFTLDYCESTPSSNDAQGISNVQLGTTDFPTGDVTYADYRDTVVDLELDNTANLQVSFATGWTYGTNVWIDFNDDLVFDATELVFSGTSQSTNPTTLDASFDIAVDAAQGTHYMRIGTADSGQGTPNPCYDGSYGVTIDMAVNVIIPGSCNDLTIWDGTLWSNGLPGANSYAYIDGAYATGTNGDIDACSLAINAATIVDALGYVNIDGNINVKTAGSLTVAHTGSVVQVQETATATNGGAISVLVDTPDLDILDFMVMGSPMSAETREGVWSTAWNVQDHTTANFNSIAGVTGFNFQDTELDDWNLYVTGVLSAGEGYLVRPQDSYNGAGGVFNYDFNTGTLNSGVVTQTLGFNVTELESPNMLSNPYASAIDADALLAANPEFDALYFWEHNLAPSPDYPGANTNGNNNYSMDDVSLYNALGGTAATSGGAAPNGVISTGQGFGVFATAGGTATFNNAMRLTTGNTTLRNNTISKDRLWLNVSSTVYNLSGNTLIGFVADATQGVDSKYDNGRVASKVSLYSHIQSSVRGYSIQAREAFEDSMTIALGFSSIIEEVTSYKISLSDFDGEAWLEATPYLVDNQTGVITNLMEDSYNFTSDMGEYNDRFEIIFQDRLLGSQESLASSIAMYPNPASDVVTIASPTAAITMVEVRDIRGRLILNKAVASQNVTTINVASLDSALYLVTITTDSGSITSRLIIE